MKKNYYVLLFVLTMYGLFAQTAHKPTVVVAPFDVCEQVKEKEANALLTRFQSELSRTKKVSVVDRKSLDKIKEQLAFQSTDWSDSDKVAELGRALNANMVIIGEITDVFDMLNITINMIDVNTTVIIASVIKEGENSKVLYDKLSDMAQELVDNMENSASIIPKEQSSIKDNKKTVNEVASVATTVQEKIVYRSPKTKTLGYTHIKNEAAFVMLLMFGTMSIVVSTSCMIAGGACDSYNLYKIYEDCDHIENKYTYKIGHGSDSLDKYQYPLFLCVGLGAGIPLFVGGIVMLACIAATIKQEKITVIASNDKPRSRKQRTIAFFKRTAIDGGYNWNSDEVTVGMAVKI